MTGTWPEHFKPMLPNQCNRSMAWTRPRALQRKHNRNIVVQIINKKRKTWPAHHKNASSPDTGATPKGFTLNMGALMARTRLQVLLCQAFKNNITGTWPEHDRNTTGTWPEHLRTNAAEQTYNSNWLQINMTGTWPEQFKTTLQNPCNTTNFGKDNDRNMAGTRPRALQRTHYRNIVMQIMDKTKRHDQPITRTHQVRKLAQNQRGSILIWGH